MRHPADKRARDLANQPAKLTDRHSLHVGIYDPTSGDHLGDLPGTGGPHRDRGRGVWGRPVTDHSPLHDALLELGLEDWIPLPEILGTSEIRDLAEGDQDLRAVSSALVDLLHEDRIQVWSGLWTADEPTVVTDDALAETLLRDARRYSWESVDDGLDRVYFVNVENFRG